MYAIIRTGGKQYKVKSGDFVEVEKFDGDAGTKVVFEEVLALGEDGGELNCGNPLVAGAKVEGEIVETFRAKKVVAFKMKRRKGYRRTHGHRQSLTKIQIGAISK